MPRAKPPLDPIGYGFAGAIKCTGVPGVRSVGPGDFLDRIINFVEQKTYQGDCEKTLPIYHPIYGNIYHPTINLSHPKCRAFHIPGFHGAYMAYNFCIYWWLENLDIQLSILPSKQQKQKTCGVLKRMNHVDWHKHVNIVQMNYTP